MPVGDVWRVAVFGWNGPSIDDPLADHSEWVNVFHFRSESGVGDESVEAIESMIVAVDKFLIAAGSFIFGKGTTLKTVETVNVNTLFFDSLVLEEVLGDEEDDVLPPQVSIAITGRDSAVGRRVTMYVPAIAAKLLDEFGRLDADVAVTSLEHWFESATAGDFLFQPVIFDREEVLPTLAITQQKVSSNFRTQRRRVLTATTPFVTVYVPFL